MNKINKGPIDIQVLIKDIDEKAKTSIEIVQKNLNAIVIGRAIPQMLHTIKVIAPDGSKSFIHHVGSIDATNANTLTVTVFDRADKALHAAIAKAITESSLDLAAHVESGNIIVKVPGITEERKIQMRKAAKQIGEEGKQVLKILRNEVIKQTKDIPSKDDQFKAATKVDERIKKWTDEITKAIDMKVAEIA